MKDVFLIGGFADNGAIGIAKHKGQLLDDNTIRDTVVFRQGESSKVEAVDGATGWKQRVAIVGCAVVAAVGPRILNELPIGGRRALRGDDASMGVDERAGWTGRFFIHQGGIALCDIVIQCHDVVLGGKSWLGPDDLAVRRKPKPTCKGQK